MHIFPELRNNVRAENRRKFGETEESRFIHKRFLSRKSFADKKSQPGRFGCEKCWASVKEMRLLSPMQNPPLAASTIKTGAELLRAGRQRAQGMQSKTTAG